MKIKFILSVFLLLLIGLIEITQCQGVKRKTYIVTPADVVETIEDSSSNIMSILRFRNRGTILIAASDAPQIIKNNADYICDGVSDQVEINNAISNPNFGAVEETTLIFSEGQFNIDSPINITRRLTIRGAGKNRTRIETTRRIDMMILNANSSWIFEMFDIKMFGGDSAKTNVLIKNYTEPSFINCEFRNSDFGIKFARTGGDPDPWNRIINCWFLLHDSASVAFDAASIVTNKIIIEGSHFWARTRNNTSSKAVWVKKNSLVSSLMINNNQIWKGGILIEDGQGFNIQNNIFSEKLGEYGIKFSDRTVFTTVNALISGNNFTKDDGSYTDLIYIGANNDYISIYNNNLFGYSNKPINKIAGTNLNGETFGNNSVNGASENEVNANIVATRNDNTAWSNQFVIRKIREGGTITNGDELGGINLDAWDGDQFIRGVSIWADISGSPTNNVMPTALHFGVNGGESWARERMTIKSDGTTVVKNKFVLESPVPPSTSSSTGVAGQIAWDTNYFYICTATNTWKRIAIATW